MPSFGPVDHGPRFGPGLVVLVVIGSDAFSGPLHVERLREAKAPTVWVIPPSEKMAARLHQLEWIAKPPSDRDIHDRHRGAGSARAIDHAVDEEITRVAEVGIKAFGVLELGVTNPRGVIPDSEILLKYLQEEVTAKVGGRRVVCAGRIGEPIPMTAGLELNRLGRLIKPAEHPAFIQSFRAGKPLSAVQIQRGNVVPFDRLEWASNELSEVTHACSDSRSDLSR
jgi:hypothetical protein